MNFNKLLFSFIVISLVLTISLIRVTSEDVNSIELYKGKNLVKLNHTNPFYVKSLIELNRDIEAVSYLENNRTIGYVDIFGGVGENFIIQEDIEYEIIASRDTNLILPYDIEVER